ncbi:MAG: hypothetical protein RIS51_740 [Actinomycetota bacterium]
MISISVGAVTAGLAGTFFFTVVWAGDFGFEQPVEDFPTFQISWQLVGLVTGFALAGVITFAAAAGLDLADCLGEGAAVLVGVLCWFFAVVVFVAQIVKLEPLAPQPQPPAAAEVASQVAENEMSAAKAISSMTPPARKSQ